MSLKTLARKVIERENGVGNILILSERQKEETQIHPTEQKRDSLPAKVAWTSPLFGRIEGGPVLEMDETTFSLIHPLTGERVTLSKEWLVSMDERAAIMEHDGGISREEADKQARIEFFGLFRKGGGRL